MIESLGIAMVKNEADIIEAFVRHNLSFMDALIIIDNDSVDDTREILVQLQQEGLPVVIFDDPVVGHFQAEIVTAVYRKVVPKFKPHFVFLLDADEFIVSQSREALYSQLRAMRPGTQAQYRLRTYIPAPAGPESDTPDPLRNITYRKADEHRIWWKTIIVTKPNIDTKLNIKQGNHGVRYAGRSLRRVRLQDVALAHFPVRSVDQLTGKILVGWIANLERNRYRLDVGHGIHWKGIYDRIIRGPMLTTEDLTLEALRYAQLSKTEEFEWPRDVVRDPVAPAYASLTTQPGATCTPLQKVVRSFDKIFNPEADVSHLGRGLEFLESSNRKFWTWRHVVRSFTADGKSETAIYIDLPPFRHVAERYCPTSVLDVGCGPGAYLKYFASYGAKRITGVDTCDRRARFLEPDEYVQADLGEPLDLAETFDLVICVDAVRDIPAESERPFVSAITRHARERIVFSGAGPGPGAGQTECRPVSHWLDLFAAAGWYPCLFDSLAVQSLSTFPWFRRDLVVLTRDGADAALATERLTESEQQPIKGKNSGRR